LAIGLDVRDTGLDELPAAFLATVCFNEALRMCAASPESIRFQLKKIQWSAKIIDGNREGCAPMQ
jgi:hypothetical protein